MEDVYHGVHGKHGSGKTWKQGGYLPRNTRKTRKRLLGGLFPCIRGVRWFPWLFLSLRFLGFLTKEITEHTEAEGRFTGVFFSWLRCVRWFGVRADQPLRNGSDCFWMRFQVVTKDSMSLAVLVGALWESESCRGLSLNLPLAPAIWMSQ